MFKRYLEQMYEYICAQLKEAIDANKMLTCKISIVFLKSQYLLGLLHAIHAFSSFFNIHFNCPVIWNRTHSDNTVLRAKFQKDIGQVRNNLEIN